MRDFRIHFINGGDTIWLQASRFEFEPSGQVYFYDAANVVVGIGIVAEIAFIESNEMAKVNTPQCKIR